MTTEERKKLMNYITAAEAAEKWGLTVRMVRIYCSKGRIQGAELHEEGWFVPDDAEKPARRKRESKPVKEDKAPYLANKLQKEKKKRRYHGLYDYTQENFTYSNNRLASNRLMRKQVVEIMKTGKVTTYSEPVKIDDLIEITNHVICIDHILETVMQPITQTYIKKLHRLLLYGTVYDRTHMGAVGSYRTKLAKLGAAKTPAPREINSQLAKLIGEYESKHEYGFADVVEFHALFEAIKPFEDGNGRVGRLLLFKECLRREIVPFFIDDKRRSAYLKGLRLWKMDREPLLTVCYQAQERYAKEIESQKLLEQHYYRLVRIGFFKGEHIPKREEGNDL